MLQSLNTVFYDVVTTKHKIIFCDLPPQNKTKKEKEKIFVFSCIHWIREYGQIPMVKPPKDEEPLLSAESPGGGGHAHTTNCTAVPRAGAGPALLRLPTFTGASGGSSNHRHLQGLWGLTLSADINMAIAYTRTTIPLMGPSR